jgi:hypothetical protein
MGVKKKKIKPEPPKTNMYRVEIRKAGINILR